jgi:dihydrofolate synthase/folylpolyglutamate synthase
MTYEEALQLWFGRVNYEQRSPRPSDLKLDRMRALLERLGNPHRELRVVHVAGSKGKGSTAAMLETVLRQAGYRTGLFTSPHLCRVEERIQIDGVPIAPAELTALMEKIAGEVAALDARRKAGAQGVTFFEVATALGFLAFLRRHVDVAVVEVGLGGRFDSTNVCEPMLAIITSISFDHIQQLGNTLARIAGEKAGIVKPSRPTLSGARAPEARAVIEETCRLRRSPLAQLDRDLHYVYEPGCVTAESCVRPRVQVTTAQQSWPALPLGLLGEHQAANAVLVVAAVEQLREQGLQISDGAVAAGLLGVHWPARLEVARRRPLVLLDCAHNGASAEALVATLQASFPAHGLAQGPGAAQRWLIFAASHDKDLAAMLEIFGPQFNHIVFTRFQSNPRAAAPERLAELLRQGSSRQPTQCPDPGAAWQLVLSQAQPHDLVCITGSVFLAGELRSLVLESEKK